MFKCTNCNSIDNFGLMLSPNYKGKGTFSKTYNEHGEIKIKIDAFEFIPDLSFMNAHAVCKFCGEIKKWDYCFNEKSKDKKPSADESNLL